MSTLWKYTPHTEGDNSFTRRSVIRAIQTSGIVAKTQVLPFSLIRGSAFCLRLQGVKKKKKREKQQLLESKRSVMRLWLSL